MRSQLDVGERELYRIPCAEQDVRKERWSATAEIVGGPMTTGVSPSDARAAIRAIRSMSSTVTLAGWSAARFGGFEWSDVEHTAASIWNRAAAPGATTPLPPAMAAATTLHLMSERRELSVIISSSTEAAIEISVADTGVCVPSGLRGRGWR